MFHIFQVVVITGASSALGQALAHKFYQAGCKVVLVSRKEHELARLRTQLISNRPSNVPIYQPETIVLDLEDLESLPGKAAQILDKCGQVDILVNNGSTTARADVLGSDVDVDIRVMNVNYFGTVALTKGTWRFNFFFFSLTHWFHSVCGAIFSFITRWCSWFYFLAFCGQSENKIVEMDSWYGVGLGLD